MPLNEKTFEQWFVLTVAPQHEAAVAQRLAAKGYNACAPAHLVRRRWSDRVKVILVPLFPGYVFCRFEPDGRAPVMSTAGVRGAVSFGGQLAPLSDCDMDRIHQITASGLQLDPLEGLRAGTRVKIVSGPLNGIEGVLSEINGATRVVVNVELLNRCIAVQVDAGAIAPADASPQFPKSA